MVVDVVRFPHALYLCFCRVRLEPAPQHDLPHTAQRTAVNYSILSQRNSRVSSRPKAATIRVPVCFDTRMVGGGTIDLACSLSFTFCMLTKLSSSMRCVCFPRHRLRAGEQRRRRVQHVEGAFGGCVGDGAVELRRTGRLYRQSSSQPRLGQCTQTGRRGRPPQ